MTTLALIGGGVAVIVILVWFLIRKAKKQGVAEQVERDRKAQDDVRKKQDSVRRSSDKSTNNKLHKGKF